MYCDDVCVSVRVCVCVCLFVNATLGSSTTRMSCELQTSHNFIRLPRSQLMDKPNPLAFTATATPMFQFPHLDQGRVEHHDGEIDTDLHIHLHALSRVTQQHAHAHDFLTVNETHSMRRRFLIHYCSNINTMYMSND